MILLFWFLKNIFMLSLLFYFIAVLLLLVYCTNWTSLFDCFSFIVFILLVLFDKFGLLCLMFIFLKKYNKF